MSINNIKIGFLASVLLIWLICGSLNTAYSANVGEMFFYTSATNGSQATVKMNSYPETASGEFTLLGDGTYLTQITNGVTGLGKRWIEPLQWGYLQVGVYRSYSSLDEFVGIRSTTNGAVESASHYFGPGEWHEGTIYMVVQPDINWNDNNRNCIFSSGSKTIAEITLQQDYGKLRFKCTNVRTDPKVIAQSTITNIIWSTEKWYFIGISWKYAEEPILYVREMSIDDGPYESPDYVSGIVDNSGFDGSYLYTNAVPGPYWGQPFYHNPITIGSYLYEPGNGTGYIYGMAAKMPYYRLDNEYMSLEEIDEVFKGLYNPPAGTYIVIK